MLGPIAVEEMAGQADLVIASLSGYEAFTGELDADVAAIRLQLAPSDDIEIGSVPGSPIAVVLVYQRGAVDARALSVSVLSPLRQGQTASLPATAEVGAVEDAVRHVLDGDLLLLQQGSPSVLVLHLPAALQAAKPSAERVVRGPNEAFTEAFYQNLALLRRMAKHPRLRVEIGQLPGNPQRQFAIAYVQGEASLVVRADLLQRLKQVHIMDVVDVTVLKPALADDPYSPFVNVQLTERVDLAAIAATEGRYVLFTAGSAQVLLLPATFVEMMNSPEDRYLPRYLGDLARVTRWLGFGIALTLESFFIAVTTIHQELLPTPLAFAIARSRSGVPLPVAGEILVMAIVVEVLREAAIRLPAPLSQTISIVGALVIGQAVVQANLISGPVIVVISVAALASFVLPQYEMALIVRFLRFPAMACAAALGLYGVAIFALLTVLHLASLRSFGVAYLSPLAPLHHRQVSRILRLPLRVQRRLQPS